MVILRCLLLRLLVELEFTSRQLGSGEGGGSKKALALMIGKVVGVSRLFPPKEVACVKAIACELPSKRQVSLSRFSLSELKYELEKTSLISSISTTTIWRILNEDAIRPWYHQSWIFPRDPYFLEKASPVLDLYQRIWNGKPLGEDVYVISADEKTQIQALARSHPRLYRL